MEQEPELGDPEAPATKADVRTAMRFVLTEVRLLRTWTEGEFKALRQELRALISEGLHETDNRMLRYFVGFFLAQVAAFYALMQAA